MSLANTSLYCANVWCASKRSLNSPLCTYCRSEANWSHKPSPPMSDPMQPPTAQSQPMSIAEKYPQYYKSVKGMDSIDVYAVHDLFDIQDPSGALQHASKKLLLSGVRTGGKTKYDDIKEARDTLTRWLELNKDQTNA